MSAPQGKQAAAGASVDSDAQRALELADASAAQLGRAYVGTEHPLPGLLEESTGPAAQILSYLGVTTDTFRKTWQHQLGKPI